jgi:primary-amine oxidase
VLSILQNKFHEAIVNLSTQTVETNVRLGANEHGNGDYAEILTVEKNALEDEGVKAEIAKLQLPEGAVVCADPWIYGESHPSHVPRNATLTICCRIRWHQR